MFRRPNVTTYKEPIIHQSYVPVCMCVCVSNMLIIFNRFLPSLINVDKAWGLPYSRASQRTPVGGSSLARKYSTREEVIDNDNICLL
jgi:hypothetical protein